MQTACVQLACLDLAIVERAAIAREEIVDRCTIFEVAFAHPLSSLVRLVTSERAKVSLSKAN